jgi:hypothetical protein
MNQLSPIAVSQIIKFDCQGLASQTVITPDIYIREKKFQIAIQNFKPLN